MPEALMFAFAVEFSWKNYRSLYKTGHLYGACFPVTVMSNTSPTLLFVLGALLLAGCAGDDTVNPVPPPDASASDASKDATAKDGASSHDAERDQAASNADGSGKDAAIDAPTEAATRDAGDAGADALADAAPDGG
jgi:hypothetical protein